MFVFARADVESCPGSFTDEMEPAVSVVRGASQHLPPRHQVVPDCSDCCRSLSPGELLATAGDRGELLVWKSNTDDVKTDAKSSKPWKPCAVLRSKRIPFCERAFGMHTTGGLLKLEISSV